MSRLAFVFCLMFTVSLATASETSTTQKSPAWPERGGPLMNGIVPAGSAKNLPVKWDEESGLNVAWKIALEDDGYASPVIGNGKVWFTSATTDGKKQFIYVIDESTGKVLHHKLIFENEDPEPLGNNVNTYASPTCVLENDAVYVHFGTYGTARLDPETAEIVWERRDIRGKHFRGPGSSPIIYEDSLILTYDCIDAQFLMSLNKKTGETNWRVDRSTDYDDLDENGKPKRNGDLRKAFGTPALVEVDGKTQLLSVGSRAAFGYDAKTGKELWTITHDGYNAAARPALHEDIVVINSGGRGASMIAVRLDKTTVGNVDETHVLWNRPRGNSRLATPLLYEGLVYMVTDNGVAICLDAVTGEEVWTNRIGGTFVASPVLANGLLYLCNEEGETSIVKAGREFQLVSKNHLEEGMRASPGVANGALFLRTFHHLYKISK
ncbi:outer membrane protein assembly factor BamB family protein [Thalassoglobus polymorphus]|uniref:Outer membrane biogenesis protein BamB n=1 Tax=Thalassoglobus polymorphus TaxID=2527994 RepID=A0A517QLR9_9PLAN|nr:PQQ-binding-like beta-propeller repeat protein [Thalassoglobus polymorphus]QDT32588.1 outer membrane biogenesis protein BamB [Thalassoglobus polymorphus]